MRLESLMSVVSSPIGVWDGAPAKNVFYSILAPQNLIRCDLIWQVTLCSFELSQSSITVSPVLCKRQKQNKNLGVQCLC